MAVDRFNKQKEVYNWENSLNHGINLLIIGKDHAKLIAHFLTIENPNPTQFPLPPVPLPA